MHPSISFIPGVASVTIKTKMRYEKERTKRFLQEICLNQKCIVFNLETCGLFLTQLSVSVLFSDTDIMKKLDIFACFIIIGGRVLKRRSVFALVPNLFLFSPTFFIIRMRQDFMGGVSGKKRNDASSDSLISRSYIEMIWSIENHRKTCHTMVNRKSQKDMSYHGQ
jgi:hypothetical protein